MKIKNALLALSLSLGTAAAVNAQAGIVVELPTNYAQNARLGNNNIPTDAVGSPYLTEGFALSTVYVNDDNPYQALLRYNAYSDEIEMKNNDNTVSSLMKRDYIKADINGQLFQVFSYEKDGGVRQGYFLNWGEAGDYTLLERKKINLKEGKTANTSYDRDKPARFIEDFDFYLQSGDAPAQMIRMKKKDILNALPSGSRAKAEAFIKSNKIKFKSPEDVLMVLKAV